MKKKRSRPNHKKVKKRDSGTRKLILSSNIALIYIGVYVGSVKMNVADNEKFLVVYKFQNV